MPQWSYACPMEQAFETMSPSERIRYVQELWDRIAETPGNVPVSDAMKGELDRRLAEHRDNPEDVLDWATVRARVRSGK